MSMLFSIAIKPQKKKYAGLDDMPLAAKGLSFGIK